MKLFSIFAIGILLSISLPTLARQSAVAFQEGQVIVRTQSPVTVSQLSQLAGVEAVEVLSEEVGIYLVKLSPGAMSAQSSLKSFKNVPGVKWAQLDHLVNRRANPNDSDFGRQWSFFSGSKKSDISAIDAWKISTGGTDKNGHDIVVAVVDGGVEIDHSDLQENIWVNKSEIAGNGIDDDGNGFVDDINGWNAGTNSPDVSGDDHATHIAGVIGARTNNGVMVAGINWNVKIMTVDQSGSTSAVVRAYEYVLKNKKLWLESQGQKGANVVSTNSSFGVDRADCGSGNYPAWNDMYQAMGEVGILSAAATANQNYDVDVVGDVPTACESPYIVAVTNTTDANKRNNYAAWGKTHVDLGAPGTDIWSTVTRNSVGRMTGTSMATPHVAGAVALLHAGASKEFADWYLTNPGEAALKLKQVLLDTVDPIADLKTRSVSGGRLNLAGAVQQATLIRPNRN